ncbi:hypothetical protein D3C77_686630 [compost metagenome]
MFAAEPRSQVAEGRNVTDHAVDVAFADVFGVRIGRTPHHDVAALVLNLVADVRHQQLGVTDPR